MEKARHFLIVVPVMLVPHWLGELRKWLPGANVIKITSLDDQQTKFTRQRELDEARSGPSAIVITTYSMCRMNMSNFNILTGRKWTWPYMIIDEAHNIKNPNSRTAKALFLINTSSRLLLSSTPVMNNLLDYYGLVKMMSGGSMLTMTEFKFKQKYEQPIMRGHLKESTYEEKQMAKKLSAELRAKTNFWILRRTRDDLLPHKGNNEATNDLQIPQINDFVIWCNFTPIQSSLYNGKIYIYSYVYII
jgi:DNA excision repair protein ERCC-6-like